MAKTTATKLRPSELLILELKDAMRRDGHDISYEEAQTLVVADFLERNLSKRVDTDRPSQ